MITFLFGISMGEILVVFLVVLLLFGADKIPEFARMMGKGINEFRKAADDIKRELDASTSDIKEDLSEVKEYLDEQKSEVEKEIKQVGEEVEDTFADRNLDDSVDENSSITSNSHEGVDEVSRDVYGLDKKDDFQDGTSSSNDDEPAKPTK